MAAAGSIAYFCKIHPSMVGSLNVASDSGGSGY
jgi:hypothetical protein